MIRDILAGFFGEPSRATTMILVEDVPDGGYYRAREVIGSSARNCRL
jgi:4-oxalocrotonate tautomerase